jgi:hypothetical protein
LRKYICRVCGRDLSYVNPPRFKCSNCYYKDRYFGGLYWKALERDNYSCVECGKNGFGKKRVINVHHINHNCKDNRIENLETLCINCHKQKRRFKCIQCGIDLIATSAKHKRCNICGKKHEQIMSYRRQAKYWKTKNANRFQWYLKELDKLAA